ncbi:HDOD domain-containing protein [Pseudoxanthomonas koreensis]|uniref:HDOD domain-containing protein n=1 Tax=Pseudoxanthomonas koreensis TaxID=266061 RepID=UPI0035A6E757
MRILFVGDETVFPVELVDLVAAMGSDWEVERCANADAAMARTAASPLDVILVAPGLPDLPPATLLGQVRTLRPETSRIAVIDGQHSPAARIIGLAHRFLPTPLAPEVLLEAIGSLEELRELLDNPELRTRIGRVEQLPSPPQLYLRLMSALEVDDSASAADIAGLVSGDPGIAAKVLQLCNSAYFSAGRTITDLRAAVTRLGIATLRDLVLASEVFSMPATPGVDRAAMQARALLAARLAKRMLPESSAELGATAALLADIGLLLPGVHDERQPAVEGDDRPGHTQAGAYLLGLWGLPMPIIEAVAFHRTPARSSTRSFWVTGAVHTAMALAAGEEPDQAYLARTGVIARLPEWREFAESLSAPATAAID